MADTALTGELHPVTLQSFATRAAALEGLLNDVEASLSAIDLGMLFERANDDPAAGESRNAGFQLLDLAQRRMRERHSWHGTDLSVELSAMAGNCSAAPVAPALPIAGASPVVAAFDAWARSMLLTATAHSDDQQDALVAAAGDRLIDLLKLTPRDGRDMACLLWGHIAYESDPSPTHAAIPDLQCSDSSRMIAHVAALYPELITIAKGEGAGILMPIASKSPIFTTFSIWTDAVRLVETVDGANETCEETRRTLCAAADGWLESMLALPPRDGRDVACLLWAHIALSGLGTPEHPAVPDLEYSNSELMLRQVSAIYPEIVARAKGASA